MAQTPSGIAAVGDLSWGTHFCQFYEGRQDLADALVPFFKAGLDQNERCLWVTSEPFRNEDARDALRNAVPDLDRRERAGQIEIVDHRDWYLRSGALSPDETVSDWIARADEAVRDGRNGLRLTGNTFWLECDTFDEFADYEATVNRRFASQRIVALCSYCLGRCRPTDVLEVVRNHQFALTRRRGAWEVIEDSSLKIARAELEQLNAALDGLVRQRTAELERALAEKEELFREVHHRVRNNLTVITSLIRMKLRQAQGTEVRQTFADVLGRVDAIALVHDTLYSAGEKERVPINDYLEKLCDGLVQLRHDQSRVLVQVHAHAVDLPLDQAVTVGLIVHELVTNALKYAFPGERRGRVDVAFARTPEHYELTIRDDGVGLPWAAEGPHRSSGLNLVARLADQLRGHVAQDGAAGTCFRITFPKA